MNMRSDFHFLQYEEDSGIGILTLNREDKLNALSVEVLTELRHFLEDICEHKLKGLIFTGKGEKAFIAGADIAAMTSMEAKEAEEFAYLGQQVTTMFEELRFPIIGAVNGFALGGGMEMALACDFILCSENAVFGLPEVSLGLIPGFGGTQRLPKIVGRNKARELIYTGRKVRANEAKELGLVLEIFTSKEEMITRSKEIIEAIGKNSPHAVGVAKVVINEGVDLTLSEGLEVERKHFGNIFNSFDMKEGTKAFVEKRKANFKGE